MSPADAVVVRAVLLHAWALALTVVIGAAFGPLWALVPITLAASALIFLSS